MSATRYSLTGGMNDKLPAEHLPDGMAALIQNMRLRDDGAWEAVKIPQYLDTIQFETPYVWRWEPVHMPKTAGKDETGVWVYFGDGTCMVLWKDINGDLDLESLKPIGTYDLDHLRVSYDAQQFVFVDGREGHGAQRITINPEREINCRAFGTQQPITPPTVNQIDNSKYEDNKYTGMPVGSILYYAYCIVNEYGERSNPSPVTVCDTAQWLAKGELLVDEYQYTDANGGSIKSVSVTCPIPVPSEAKRVELYRAHAEYFESFRPVDPMRLVRSVDLQDETNSVTIMDASFTSPVEIDYENDAAPAGDDIVLESGTLFVANAVSDRTFAYPVSKVWMIHLDNQNTINYVNRWFTIDIRDEGDCGNLACFEGLTDAGAICEPGTRNKWRFVDTDMITPLKAYMCPGPGTLRRLNGVEVVYSNLTHIQVPYMMASAEKIVYLVEFAEQHSDYANPCEKIANVQDAIDFYEQTIENPVRDENCIIAQGRPVSTPRVSGNYSKMWGNKANRIYEAQGSAFEKTGLPDVQTPRLPYTYNEVLAMPFPVHSRPLFAQAEELNAWCYGMGIFENISGWKHYDNTHNMPSSRLGYLHGEVYADLEKGETKRVFRLMTELPEEGTGRDFREILGEISRDSDGEGYKFKISTALVDYMEWGDFDWPDSNAIGEIYELEIPVAANNDEFAPKIFLFYSWALRMDTNFGNTDDPTYITDYNDTMMGAVVIRSNRSAAPVVRSLQGQQRNYFQDMPVYAEFWNEDNVATGNWYLSLGEFIDNPQEFMAFSHYGTHFESPAAVIGWRSETSNNRVVNKNITWEAYELRNERRPGKIRWSLGGAVPELYERNIFQEIKRIIPLKSWQPTDEHNTMLIWTKDKVLRMALAGDNREASALITEMHGVGLQNPEELAQVTEGVIWKDGNAVYLLNANSLKEIARQVVDLADETMTALYDKKNKEVLFIPADGNAYCYNLKWNAWSRLDYGLDAKQFIEYDGKWCLVADGVYDLDPEDDTKLAPLIRTKKHPAKLKLRRLTIHPASGNVRALVRALIHNHRLAAGYTASPTYTLSGDDPKAMPQLSGDYVQFEIVTDTIHTYDIEAAD